MGAAVTYIFDTNVWIAAHSEVYAPGVFPGVWQRFEEAAENGTIVSPPQVLEEIAGKDDEVNRWIRARRKQLTRPMTAGELAQKAENSVPLLQEKHPQLSHKGADYYVVAWGKILKCAVVTLENEKSTRKIPAVCRKENIACISPLVFMRRQGWKFPAP